MKLTIITVSFNSQATIEDTILSVASQNYSDIEYIIVDGGSVDGTVDLIKQHENKVSRWISEPDNGIYDAMNKGIAMSTGDVIGILNSDDVYADNKVLEYVATAFGNPSIDSCYADLVYVDQNDVNRIVRYWKSCDYKNGLFEKGWAPPHPTFYVRKSIYEKYGNFDLDYKLAADFEIMMRFIEKYKIKTVYFPKVFVKMRLGGATNKSFVNIIKQNYEIMLSYKKNSIKLPLFSFLTNKVAAKVRQFQCRDKWDES